MYDTRPFLSLQILLLLCIVIPLLVGKDTFHVGQYALLLSSCSVLFSKSMRIWGDGPICGNGRKDDTREGGDCISPNGQNSDGPIQCRYSVRPSTSTTTVRTPIESTVSQHNYYSQHSDGPIQYGYSVSNYYGQHSDRPGKRKRPVSSQHTDHYFGRTLFCHVLSEFENIQSARDNPEQLRVAGSLKSV